MVYLTLGYMQGTYPPWYTASSRVHLACSTLLGLSVLPLLADGRVWRRPVGLREGETRGWEGDNPLKTSIV